MVEAPTGIQKSGGIVPSGIGLPAGAAAGAAAWANVAGARWARMWWMDIMGGSS
jgi:hypothetical protein